MNIYPRHPKFSKTLRVGVGHFKGLFHRAGGYWIPGLDIARLLYISFLIPPISVEMLEN